MARAKKPVFNYSAELKLLKQQGPGRLYLVYGEEEYLRDRFLDALRSACVPAEANEFSVRRMAGKDADPGTVSEAVNALPFFTERTYVEIRDYDLNHCKDEGWKRLQAILKDIPDWCTVVFVQSPDQAPDGRLAAVKGLKKLGRAVEVTLQDTATLTDWVCKRFLALGKKISRGDAEYLIFLSGTAMLGLIPEIEKAAAFAAGPAVTRAELDATVNRIPEADVWNLTDRLAAGEYDKAAAVLGDLLADKDNHPILLTAILGQQFRRMYAAKVCLEEGRSRSEAMELCDVRFDFIFDKLRASVRPYTAAQLGRAVSLCAEYDYRMKSTGLDPKDLLLDLFGRVAAGML